MSKTKILSKCIGLKNKYKRQVNSYQELGLNTLIVQRKIINRKTKKRNGVKMNPKLGEIRETINQTKDCWDRYTLTTRKLDDLIRQYMELKNDEIDIYSKSNKIEINFRIIPNQEIITKIIYLSKSLQYQYKRNSLTSYTLISKN